MHCFHAFLLLLATLKCGYKWVLHNFCFLRRLGGEFLVLFIIAVGGGEARGIEVAVDEGEALELLLVYRLYHLGHDRRQDRILLRKLSVEIQCVLLVFLHTERIMRVITYVFWGKK
jgi:hypothetical protein